MEEQDVLDEMSGDHSGSDQGLMTTDDQSTHLPVYLAYLSLGFKVISTVIITLMAGWVIITIKTTRSLHKTHNIYVAYLMAIEAVTAIIYVFMSGTIMIGYFTGVGDFIGCNVYVFMLHPIALIFFTFLAMSIDKVIAVTFPFKHRKIMKPRVVFGIIVVKHILAILMFVRNLFKANDFTKVAQFGKCTTNDSGVLEILFTIRIPLFLVCLTVVSLDVYLSVKACIVHKQIQKESKLSGGHKGGGNQLKALKKIEANIKRHLKPMKTLLVVVIGNSLLGIFIQIMYFSTLECSVFYESVVRNLVVPNVSYVVLLLHPFAYALYFKEIRKPMMNLMRRVTCPCKCKSAAVVPQPPTSKITWI